MRLLFSTCAAALSFAVPAFAADTSDLLERAIDFGAAEWNHPQEPVKIYGDTYYVGVAGLSSILIATDAGLILLDGHLPQSVPLNAVSAPAFHFLADASHWDLTASFRKSIRTVANLPCDVLVSVHPDLTDVPEKILRQLARATPNPFIDKQACRKYASVMEAKLDARIDEEKSAVTR